MANSDNDDFFDELCGISFDTMTDIQDDYTVLGEEVLQSIQRAIVEGSASNVRAIKTNFNNKYNSTDKNPEEELAITRLQQILNVAEMICEGQYVEILQTSIAMELFQECTEHLASNTDHNHISTMVHAILTSHLSREVDFNRSLRIFELLYIGVACLNIYIQANYTGPAFEHSTLQPLQDILYHALLPQKDIEESKEHNDTQDTNDKKSKAYISVLIAMHVDGDSPHTTCEIPEFMLMARCILQCLGNYKYCNYTISVDIFDEYNREPSLSEVEKRGLSSEVQRNDELISLSRSLDVWWVTKLWNARAAIAHERLLLSKEPSNTLWNEVRRCYLQIIRVVAPISTTSNATNRIERAKNAYFVALLHVEWGLAQHHFQKMKHGKLSFDVAKDISGISVLLSGSMGKRTKYQQKSLAQMVLFAASSIDPDEYNRELNDMIDDKYAKAVAASTHVDFGGEKNESSEITVNEAITEGEEAVTEVQRLIQEGIATYREVELDQADPDNYLLESIAFDEKKVVDHMTEDGNLQIVDQLILLALCLDVKNSNANDGLTREEMWPYITRVLKNPNNWMVYSTALLERAWLEYESTKRRERAVLQMQALVDQHTTRLTITQSTYASIQDAAPAKERMKFIHGLVFPPRYALKRDLADRYMSLGVIGSALQLCEELELWDDVVKCYQLLEQPKKAEILVRQRLEISPTPYMWCCLGDLTENPEHYETSWELSRHRFARAKRSLARMAMNKGEIEPAISHFKDAVAVNPMNTGSWFTMGALSMKVQNWEQGLTYFTKVVQLEPETADAWANIGSIYMTLNRFDEGYSVYNEALKHKRTSWQMWENYLTCAIQCKKYGDAMYAFHKLLDLRDKHKRPVDHEILAWLVQDIVYPKSSPTADVTESAEIHHLDDITTASEEQASEAEGNLRGLTKKLAELFGRITSIVTNDDKVWQLYAHFNDGLPGRHEKAIDCRLKQCRALQKAGWDSEKDQIVKVCRAATRLAQDYANTGSRNDVSSCRLYLRGILRKTEANFADLDEYKALKDAVQQYLST